MFLETVGRRWIISWTRRDDDDVRSVEAPQWSIIRLSRGKAKSQAPNTKERPGRDLFVPTPPRHYIPLITHHLSTPADHLLCFIPSLHRTKKIPFSILQTLAHHGQLSRAAQGLWHCKSRYPAKPLKCVELDGELQGVKVVAILSGQAANRLPLWLLIVWDMLLTAHSKSRLLSAILVC
jgi:hypothetical protein